MARKTPGKTLLDSLADLARPYAIEGADKALGDKLIDARKARRALEALGDAFEELAETDGNRRRALRRIRDLLLEGMDTEIEREVDDTVLRQAVKIVRENVIGRREKEALAEALARMLVEDWAKFPRNDMEEIIATTEALRERTEKGLKAGDKAYTEGAVDLGTKLVTQWLRRMPEDDLRRITRQSVDILSAASAGRSTENLFLDTSRASLEKLGVIRAMRQAFAGLLLGDLLLRQIGKTLGLKERLSVTDFIFFLGARIFDRQVVPEMDRGEAAELKVKLEKILNAEGT